MPRRSRQRSAAAALVVLGALGVTHLALSPLPVVGGVELVDCVIDLEAPTLTSPEPRISAAYRSSDCVNQEDQSPSPEGAASPTERISEGIYRARDGDATAPTQRAPEGSETEVVEPVAVPADDAADFASGLPWRSGITVGTPDQVNAWAEFRGSEVDVVHAFAERGSWDGIESADWILGYYADFPGMVVISQPFWPEGSGGSLEQCAGGAYDTNWAAYGNALTSADRTDAITRLAWEFNGDWFEWSATDVDAWKECYRAVVSAVRTTAPEARFEWAMNAHGSQTSDGDAWLSYPGDDVVDVVGIDPYDHYPSSPTEAEFDEQCTDNEGLCTVIEFAREHGKGVGVGEWGVIGDAGGGDNPVYISKMFDTFTAGADVMTYETYFNAEEYGNALVNPVQNPESSELYVSLWGGSSSPRE